MADQLLIPFKANFTLNVKTTIEKFFSDKKEIDYNTVFSKITNKDNSTVDLKNFIIYYELSFYLYSKYKNLNLKFHQVYDISPKSVSVKDKDFELSFKLDSFPVKVLQIVGLTITFSNSDDKVSSIDLTDDLELIELAR